MEFDKSRADILSKVKELKETSNIMEIAQLLSSGNWIGIYAIEKSAGDFVFALGRIR